MSDVYFEAISKLYKRICITKSRWILITKTKHLEVEHKEKEVKETLINPEEVRLSKSDSSVYIYYKHYARLSLAVVAKHKDDE